MGLFRRRHTVPKMNRTIIFPHRGLTFAGEVDEWPLRPLRVVHAQRLPLDQVVARADQPQLLVVERPPVPRPVLGVGRPPPQVKSLEEPDKVPCPSSSLGLELRWATVVSRYPEGLRQS